MNNFPACVNRHIDATDINKDGELIFASSSLTGRYWNGSLWFYKKIECAPNVEESTSGAEIHDGVSDIKWLPGTNKLFAAIDSGGIQLWELDGEPCLFRRLSEYVQHDSFISNLSINSDNTRMASASQDYSIKLWDITEELTCVKTYNAHSNAVMCANYHPTDPNIFISCSQDGRVLTWDIRKQKPASKLGKTVRDGLPTYAVYQPGTDNVVVSTETGEIAFVDTRAPTEHVVSLQPHTRSVHRMTFSQSTPQLLGSTSDDSTVAVMETNGTNTKIIHKDTSFKDFTRGICWNNKTSRFYASAWDSSIKCIDHYNVGDAPMETQCNGGTSYSAMVKKTVE